MINNKRIRPRKKVAVKSEHRCYHCGGAIRLNGDFYTCIMCSREKGHLCPSCSHQPSKVAVESKKISA
ncbi:MAG: hypothetical protein COV67_02350 [Nitrospinae bacterium CG11_big_fil_rev_8_21_14_0_20_56_8]|nr:MAG: hypothetical protein COV67_02350 [Nitrospinae bacterium CG11_big_fil_rev_8_21_14_0_20_56_8]